jgi:hypothetical protein
MARNKGTFKFAANFEVKLQGALDPRILVDNKSELINKETWPYDGDTIYVYNGLLVAVAADKAIYMLVDKDKILEADYSGWKQMDVAAAQTVEIIDNLSSSSTTAALSANQGRVLGQRVTTLESKISSVYSYKGSKATYAELPGDAAAGDVWNVEEAHDNHPAGTNWAWTGSAWDALGGAIDLSSYYNKTQADAAIKAAVDVEKGAREAADTELDGKITTNTQAIAKINGSADTEGSLANTLKQAKDYADTKVGDVSNLVANKVDKVEGSTLIPEAKLALIDTNASDIDALEVRVAANEAKLVGITTTVVSTINTAIDAAMAWHEVTE